MTLILTQDGREFWVQFDRSASVYEMFASRDGGDYLGCFDTKREALAYAKRCVEEAY